ncbi:MAG: hypothetical protein AAFV90_28100 [Cyanobacteria bacterium J06634_5]
MLATKPITTLIEAVNYEPEGRCFRISLDNGASLLVPVDLLVMELWEDGQLKAAPRPTDAQLSTVQVWSGGRSIDIDCIKQNFGLAQLLKAIAV